MHTCRRTSLHGYCNRSTPPNKCQTNVSPSASMAPQFLLPHTSVTLVSSNKASASPAMSSTLQKQPSFISKTLCVFAPPSASPSQPLKRSSTPSSRHDLTTATATPYRTSTKTLNKLQYIQNSTSAHPLQHQTSTQSFMTSTGSPSSKESTSKCSSTTKPSAD